jgi:hypothetical protein
MKIRKQMIDGYLRNLTMGRAANMSAPLSDLTQFDPDIRAMHRDALLDGNLEWLRLSLESLLANPRGRIGAFTGALYPFDDAELEAIFRHAHAQIWPDRTVPDLGDEADLEFVEMSRDDWAAIAGGN